MAASSEEAPRKIPSRERTAGQMPIVFRGVHSPGASKDCLGLLSQGEVSIAFCPVSAHCDGSGSSSPRHRTHHPLAPTDRRGWPRNVSLQRSVGSGSIVGHQEAIHMSEKSPMRRSAADDRGLKSAKRTDSSLISPALRGNVLLTTDIDHYRTLPSESACAEDRR